MNEVTRTEKFLKAAIDGAPSTLKPITRVEKLLAELNEKLAGSGGGSSSGIPTTTEPHMQLVTDADGKMVWDARYTVIVSNAILPYSADMEAYALNETPEMVLEEGKIYIVQYNDGNINYSLECTAVAVSFGEGLNYLALGNTSIFGVSGGNELAQFVIMEPPDTMAGSSMPYLMVMPLVDATESLTLSILGTGKIAPVSGYPGPLFITADIGNDSGSFVLNSISATYAEIVAAINSGRDVICITTHVLDADTSSALNGKSLLRLVMFGDNNLVLSCRNVVLNYEVSIFMMSSGVNAPDVKEI